MNRILAGTFLVALLVAGGAGAFVWWVGAAPAYSGGRWPLRQPFPSLDIAPRLPGETIVPPDAAGAGTQTPVNPGTTVAGPGRPSALSGSWPGFRGPKRDGIAHDAAGLLRAWPPEGPKVLWRVALGEGYAGPAVHRGRVFLFDYDQEKKEDAFRCLSLDDGREIWRYAYSNPVKRNHGMSRTVPAVAEIEGGQSFVVGIGPKCHAVCLKADTGEKVWVLDLVKDFGTTVPPWYAGQCVLIDGDVAIIAPGGDPLMMAVELATGRIRWRTPNPGGHVMTHSSIMPIETAGGRQYVYCTSLGVVGVSAVDGKLLWTSPDWKIAIANVPSPVPVGADRLFLTGGYDSGSLMLRLTGGGTAVEPLFRLKPQAFSCEQHTPILYRDHLYGVLPGGELACADLTGAVRWTSGPPRRFGLGPLLLADGMLYVLEDESGTLRLVAADPAGYQELAAAKVLVGHDAWAPMALASGRLLLRDLTEMVCLEVGGAP